MKNNIVKWGGILLVTGIVVGGSVVFYLFNMPHRDVQATAADFQMEAMQLVNEYLADAESANEKYLQEEGNSKIIAVTGMIASKDKDLNRQEVVLLKNAGDKAGISCTFTASTNAHALNLQKGQIVTIKGVIRAGAGYDEDLQMYEDVIMEKCDVLYN